jgi:hypothetical protein
MHLVCVCVCVCVCVYDSYNRNWPITLRGLLEQAQANEIPCNAVYWINQALLYDHGFGLKQWLDDEHFTLGKSVRLNNNFVIRAQVVTLIDQAGKAFSISGDDRLINMTKPTMQRTFTDWAVRAGYPRQHFTFHALRSGFVVQSVANANIQNQGCPMMYCALIGMCCCAASLIIYLSIYLSGICKSSPKSVLVVVTLYSLTLSLSLSLSLCHRRLDCKLYCNAAVLQEQSVSYHDC